MLAARAFARRAAQHGLKFGITRLNAQVEVHHSAATVEVLITSQ